LQFQIYGDDLVLKPVRSLTKLSQIRSIPKANAGLKGRKQPQTDENAALAPGQSRGIHALLFRRRGLPSPGWPDRLGRALRMGCTAADHGCEKQRARRKS
jgi:hypothetical protein